MTSTRYRFGRFSLLPKERQLLADGATVHLGPHAFDLLVVLVERSGRLVTKEELLSRVWPRVVVEENTLQVHVSALRKVLGAEAIATVSGRGYRFVLHVAQEHGPTPAPRHNLPYQLTSFIGREAQIAEIRRLLSGTRLLTLNGAGGCGKTRLALQVAGELVAGFTDGVWLVELAPLGDPLLVAHEVARVLAIDEQPARQIADTLAARLGSRHLLLVLDNAEHLLGACAQLADQLLRRCAQLSLLVTSRERLGIEGEVAYRVPSLSVPDATPETTSVEVLACEAARLFIERARLQRPGFDVTARDAAALASICRRLDGIALAIELAAPRVRHMSLQELSSGLDRRFGLLTGGSRTALPRHRTLRSLIDWSYDLLADAERLVLQRASVFAGGWDLAAAERVCGGTDIAPGDVQDLLTSLVDKNLVLVDVQDESTRFGMLETVRHYAQDRLRDSGDEAAVRTRHLDHVLILADRLDKADRDDERRSEMVRLDRERDNIRAALAWCETGATLALSGLRLAGRLFELWDLRGAYGEGRGWIARMLAVAPTTDLGEVHATAFHVAGSLAYIEADFEQAEVYHRQALAVARQRDDRRQVARSLGSLGNVAFSLENHESARASYGECLVLAREIGNVRLVGAALYALGLNEFECGELADAQAFLEESLVIDSKLGEWSASRPRAMLGVIRHMQGDRQAARALLSEALAGSAQLGDRGLYSRVSDWLAMLDLDEGDAATAASRIRDALTIQNELDGWVMLGYSLQAAACVGAAIAGPAVLARLLGAAQGLRRQYGRNHDDFDMRVRLRPLETAARGALRDDAAFDFAWDEGKSMTQHDAVRQAVALMDQVAGGSGPRAISRT